MIKRTYYAVLPDEAEHNRHDNAGFFEWLRAIIPEAATDDSVGPRSNFRASLGDASFLFVAPHPDSPLSIDFSIGEDGRTAPLNAQEMQQWQELQKDFSRPGEIARQFGACLTLHGDRNIARVCGLDGIHLPANADAARARTWVCAWAE